jgi:hypothetical protein
MVQKGGQTANSGGIFDGLKKAFSAAAKVFNPGEQPTTYQPIATTTRPQALATPLQNSSVNSIGAPSKDPLSSPSLRPSMTGGKRKRTRKNKRHLKKKRTFRR